MVTSIKQGTGNLQWPLTVQAFCKLTWVHGVCVYECIVVKTAVKLKILCITVPESLYNSVTVLIFLFDVIYVVL